MNHRMLYPLFTILVLISCSRQTPAPAVPIPPSTVTTIVLPTSGPIQVETPVAQLYGSGEPVGFIMIPGLGDAGNFFLDAGSTVTLTWSDPPREASRYDFTMLDTSGIPFVIGTDIDSTDGVSVHFSVLSNLPGFESGGIAYTSEGQPAYFAYGETVYPCEALPQDNCTLSNRTIGPFPVHLEPNPSAQIFGNFVAGQYVQVYEHRPDVWYRIHASQLEIFSNTILICGESPTSPCRGYSDRPTSWIQAKGNVRFFGPCDQFSNSGEAEQGPNPNPSPESSPVGNPSLSPKILFPTEIPTTSTNEQTGVRIFGHASTNDGSGLSSVRIFLSLAAYPGEIVATTDKNGDFRSDFKFIPGDENVTIWAELDGYSFTPSNYLWRHYHGFEDRTFNFTALASSSTSIP
jgi:hypothetical protein